MSTFTVRIVGPPPAVCANIISCTEIKKVKKLDNCYYQLTTQLNESGLERLLANCATQDGYPDAEFEIDETAESA